MLREEAIEIINRDMEEIAEIMKSDADAETKCKMISNILTAKPHYFELSQEPTIQDKQAESEKYQKAFDDGYANGYAQAKFDYEQEPKYWIDHYGHVTPINPPIRKGHWLHKEIIDNYRVTGQCSECKERRIIDNFCPHCGASMVDMRGDADAVN